MSQALTFFFILINIRMVKRRGRERVCDRERETLRGACGAQQCLEGKQMRRRKGHEYTYDYSEMGSDTIKSDHDKGRIVTC